MIENVCIGHINLITRKFGCDWLVSRVNNYFQLVYNAANFEILMIFIILIIWIRIDKINIWKLIFFKLFPFISFLLDTYLKKKLSINWYNKQKNILFFIFHGTSLFMYDVLFIKSQFAFKCTVNKHKKWILKPFNICKQLLYKSFKC